ncbi:LutB/LldF family L-lactate oxidation iron-sulfur protein [Stomatohabitans albus]|uniref:LutB/LldF family L-lactate oxidation iron-sulfur protein n=1 Tax=Stomatohabitans albus TaxID=3110766 RepID=UPI00300D7850
MSTIEQKKRLTPAPPSLPLVDQPTFPKQAKVELNKPTQRANLRFATTTIRKKRQARVNERPDWQAMRVAGGNVKDRVLRHMDTYLEQLEVNLTKNGAQVHWAKDAEEANRIIVDIVKSKGVQEVVKVKSMATQETDLNEALEEAGIAAWETDLAELIVQMGHDRPSHILVPAIHRNRAEVREIFLREMKLWGRPAPEDVEADPAQLAGSARLHLREKFLRAKVSISGANFAIAETGTLCVVESEGNGRMCLTLPDTLISLVGIEKMLPTFQDLELFTQLLPRSSTAEKMNPYTSMWTGVTPGDGPQEVHVVLMDNGRTSVLSDTYQRQALRCIRCSACMNVCPVYERVGGHAYGSVYPGPIGSVLTPQLRGVGTNPVADSLPFASSLCGACTEVCPVSIDLADMLVDMRHKVTEAHRGGIPSFWDVAMGAGGRLMGSPMAWEASILAASSGKKMLPMVHGIGPTPMTGPLYGWTRARDMPMPAKESFRQWWKKNRKGE